MSSALDDLDTRTRRDVEALAIQNQVTPEALLPEIVAAYIRLLREVPDALPRNPLAQLCAGAQRRAKL
jgi:hypothetical protein